MKAYTDLEQSKKLAEILPPESADMCHKCIGDESYDTIVRPYSEYYEKYRLLLISKDFNAIPCWSLAALLDVLPPYIEDSIGMIYSLNMDKEYIEYSNPNISSLYSAYIHTTGNDNLVDACVDMIIKLHEQNLL